jgi:hypothetical protein
VPTRVPRPKRNRQGLHDAAGTPRRSTPTSTFRAVDERARTSLRRRRQILTAEDRELIADAVRQGLRPEPISRRIILFHLILAVAATAAAVWGYQALRDWRLPVQLSMSASSVADVRHLELRGTPSQDDWKTSLRGRADIAITSRSETDLTLPVKRSECGSIAIEVGGRCEDGVIRMPRVYVQLFAGPRELGGRSLQGQISGNDATRISVEFETMGKVNRNKFTYLFAELHGNQPVSMQFQLFGRPLTAMIASGVDRHVETLLSTGNESGSLVIELHPVSPGPLSLEINLNYTRLFSLRARAPVADIQGFSGAITTSAEGRQVLNPAAHLVVTGTTTNPADLVLAKNPNSSLELHTDSAESALADEAQLVPSVWDRYSAVVVPLWSGLFGILVLTELATALRGSWSRSASRSRGAGDEGAMPARNRERTSRKLENR